MQTPGKRSVGLIVGGALLILAAGGGGGYVTSVWSADRDFDEHRITKLEVELREHTRPSDEIKRDIQFTEGDRDKVTRFMMASGGATTVGVLLGGLLVALGLRRRPA